MLQAPIVKLYVAADKAAGDHFGLEIRITKEMNPGLLAAAGRSVVSMSPAMWKRWEENVNDMSDGPSGNNYSISFLEGWYKLSERASSFNDFDIVEIGQDLLQLQSEDEARAYTQWVWDNRRSVKRARLESFRAQHP